MAEIIKTHKYLLSKRAKIIKFLKKEGFSGQDIADIFNIDRSSINRILRTEKNYKGLVKKILED